MTLRGCLDAVVGAIHLVTEALAFLFGLPLLCVLSIIRFLFLSSPGQPETHQSRASLLANFVARTDQFHRANPRFELAEALQARQTGLRHRTRVATHGLTTHRQPRGAGLHFPVAAQVLNAVPDEERSLHHHHALLGNLEQATRDIAEKVARASQRMLNVMEEHGGPAGRLAGCLRSPPQEINKHLAARLPPEIVRHILLLAAAPLDDAAIPTKIALLSKQHHRLITTRLYGAVHLRDAATFRLFRMTLAVSNPSLGKHLQSLAIASSTFDREGYLPEQVSEHTTLGIGIEQILLSAPNLQHLYLDLFSLAALHHSTAARLEKGSLPISLTTEFSLPQYLTLPTFAHLQHVELTVFGLDVHAAEFFRQALPRLQTLTLRWVTRWSRAGSSGMAPLTEIAEGSGSAQNERRRTISTNDDGDDRISWHQGSRKGEDLALFIEALDLLRHWPHDQEDAAMTGQQLKAISVYAWPQAHRELSAHYRQDSYTYNNANDGSSLTLKNGQSIQWDASRASSAIDSGFAEDYDVNRLGETFPSQLNTGLVPPRLPAPAPLRLAIDESYAAGPRRGPLQSWCQKQTARTWSL